MTRREAEADEWALGVHPCQKYGHSAPFDPQFSDCARCGADLSVPPEERGELPECDGGCCGCISCGLCGAVPGQHCPADCPADRCAYHGAIRVHRGEYAYVPGRNCGGADCRSFPCVCPEDEPQPDDGLAVGGDAA